MSKVWLITGSSRGLGRSLAEEVLASGDKLIATARKADQLQDLVERYGSHVHPVSLDVTKTDEVKKAIATAFDVFGKLDVVVNNAGYGNIAAIEETSEEDFRAQIETNLWGVINVSKAVLPYMIKQGSGHIIQISSVGGRTGAPGLGAYQTAKWAVEGFSEVLSKEIAPLGIKVSIVEPGGFRTDWAGASMQHVEPGENYKSTVGQMLQRTRESSGKQPGDPVKGARAIITIANAENPPLRLLMGSDAVKIANMVDQAKLDETKRWEQLSVSTDY
ncbi:short-chain dehydrogenase/reductase [Paenibacillus glycanilyticus]|uniref:Short-chain dehydrogenase/reductase n=1 Tax=Paenibacillus glycanilyticus TaxID=126569 RepID=A0ABQ6NQV1_9BACL|nr:oxidoreductase [Paenibacillus glycanilyticus]GMK47473.1 short-chain dehydrogenase/reductase [Paenibacillus glycanilyticus]